MVKCLLVDTEKDGKTKSFILAEMLYNMAAGGNLEALKFIMEQVDGKAPQSLNVNANINDRPDIEKLRGIDPLKISQIIDSAFLDE
jgi:hypothetical protein